MTRILTDSLLIPCRMTKKSVKTRVIRVIRVPIKLVFDDAFQTSRTVHQLTFNSFECRKDHILLACSNF